MGAKKLKHRLNLFGFVIFFFVMSGLALNVNAISYKPSVNEDDELIWKCKICNDAEMSLIFVY